MQFRFRIEWPLLQRMRARSNSFFCLLALGGVCTFSGLLLVTNVRAQEFSGERVCEVVFDRKPPLLDHYRWKAAALLEHLRGSIQNDYANLILGRTIASVAQELRNDRYSVRIYAPNAREIRKHALSLVDLLGPSPLKPRYTQVPIYEPKGMSNLFHRIAFLAFSMTAFHIGLDEFSRVPMVYDIKDAVTHAFKAVVSWSTIYWWSNHVRWKNTAVSFPIVNSGYDSLVLFQAGLDKTSSEIFVDGVNQINLAQIKLQNSGDFLFQTFKDRDGNQLFIFYGIKSRDPKLDLAERGKRSENDEPFLLMISSKKDDPRFEFDEPDQDRVAPSTDITSPVSTF